MARNGQTLGTPSGHFLGGLAQPLTGFSHGRWGRLHPKWHHTSTCASSCAAKGSPVRKIEPKLTEPRVEVVTASFVAAGRPEGIHDLGRLLENLNNGMVSRHIELADPAIRPLYRATASLSLEAPLLIRREDIIFATFDGPHFTRATAEPETFDVPVLLMAPPFQIQGVFAVQQDADVTQALRFATRGFFPIRDTRVFDADGAPLGEGEGIVVNGAAVQMMSASRQHISVVATVHSSKRTEAQDVAVAVDTPQNGATRAA